MSVRKKAKNVGNYGKSCDYIEKNIRIFVMDADFGGLMGYCNSEKESIFYILFFEIDTYIFVKIFINIIIYKDKKDYA